MLYFNPILELNKVASNFGFAGTNDDAHGRNATIRALR